MGHPAPADRTTTSDPATGHIDQDAERPEGSGHIDGGQHVVVVGHVPGGGGHPFAQRLRQFAGPIAIAVKDDHPCTDLDQPTNRRRPETSGPAGDNGRPSL